MTRLMVLVSIVVLSLFAIIVGIMLYVHESPDQALIRKYLRENTPTGKWEEVKWDKITDDGFRATTLKFRTHNQLGAMSLYSVGVLEADGVKKFKGINDNDFTQYHSFLGWKPDPDAPRSDAEAVFRNLNEREKHKNN
jgi:hypothetical protein